MKERDFLVRLHLCPGIGLNGEYKLYQFYQKFTRLPTPIELQVLLNYTAKQAQNFYDAFKSEQLTQKVALNITNSQVLTIVDEQYPLQLKEIYQPPLVLFCKGDLKLLQTPMLAIVGARQMSSYATQVLESFMPKLAMKLTIVSGLAQGVDSLAQNLTLKNYGKTIAVIGTGLNISYPKSNAFLQQEIGKKGLLLSEYGLDEKPLRFHFPYRNRIIAGLAQATLVVEARHKSGSLITANLALQENRDVLAIPGSLYQPLSEGCNELIQAGAKLILTPQDIIEEFSNYLTNFNKIE